MPESGKPIFTVLRLLEQTQEWLRVRDRQMAAIYAIVEYPTGAFMDSKTKLDRIRAVLHLEPEPKEEL